MVASLLATLIAVAGADEVVARVDGAAITGSSVARQIEANARSPRPPSAEQVLSAMVDQAVLAAEGRRLGLADSAPVKQRVAAETRRAAAEALVLGEVARHEPDDARLREMFHATGDFVSFESLTFETAAAAQASLRRIQGGASFSSEAANAVTSQLYASPEKAPPQLRAQLEPVLAQALFAAAPGAVVGPFQLSLGTVIARLIRKEVAPEAGFAQRRPALLEHARRQTSTAVRQRLASREREASGVKVDEAFLEALKGAPTAAQLEHPVAVVHGKPIPYREVDAKVRELMSASGHGSGSAIRVQVAWQVVDEVLVQDLAVQRGLDRSPEVAVRLPELERFALADAAAARIRTGAPAPTEREIQAVYDRDAARYGRPFAAVLPAVAARAAAEKGEAHLRARTEELRKKASVSIDTTALSRAATARAGSRP